MASLALTDLLMDFGKRQEDREPRRVVPAVAFEPDAGPLALGGFVEPPAPDVDAMIAEAVAEAEALLEQRLSAEAEERLEAERSRHAEEIAALEARFSAELATAVDEKIAAMEARLNDLTGDVVSRILAPLLAADLQEKAIEALRTSIDQALREDGAVRIVVRGPRSLHDELAARLGARADMLEFTEADGLDLSVEIGDVVFETRLADWSASVEEILA